MISLLVILVALCLWKIRFAGFHENYCDKDPTTAIKGLFALIIFFSHCRGYLQLEPTLTNRLFNQFFLYLDQSMVALYFFYSGYGICESLKRKEGYRNRFLKHRFLKTLLHFDLAVLLFVIASFIPPITHIYPLKNYLLCWTGWESVGNSNWFMFAILALYLIAYGAMWIRGGWMAIKVLLPTALLWILLFWSHKGDHWWYDTLITFPLGMLYAQLKPRIDQALHRPATWWATLVGLTLVYVIMHHLIGVDKWGIVSCLFCLMIVVGTMKVQIGNPVLKWVGIHAFAIYILQRLPMNLLSDWGISPQTAVFVPCAIIATFLLAAGFTWATDHIDKKLFGHA